MLIGFPIKNHVKYQKNIEIKGNQQYQKWNSSYNPHIFGLISDAHITPFRPSRIADTKSILKILNESGVEKILVAGDISDNFGTNFTFKLGKQYEEDFIEYRKIASEYPSDFLIVASGNHDEFDVEEYNSKDHYILQYCDFYKNNEIYKKYENFLISRVNYEDIEIFVMNPYHYPTVRAGVGYYMYLTTEMLDIIEKILSEQTYNTTRLLITHFSTSFSNRNVYSTSGKTLSEILTSSNIVSTIAGHSHAYRVIHRNSSLEVHSPSINPGRRSGQNYGYILIDNGYFSYHMSKLNENRLKAVLAYPIEKKYLSKMTDFSRQKFDESEIRVVTFSEDSKLNISVTCTNEDDGNRQNGFLQFQRVIRSNQSLYSIPLKNICGELRGNDRKSFTLNFSGDWSYTTEFIVGESVTFDKEIIEDDLNLYTATFSVGFILYIFVLFVWCPFISPPKFCSNVNMWISGATMNSMVKYFGLFFGFLPMKSRIYSNLSKKCQFLYFIVAVSPLFLPISIMKIGQNHFGLILSFGYYLNGFVIDVWGFDLFALFVVLVLVPSTIVFSSISQFKQTIKFKFVFVFDVAMSVAQIPLLVFLIGRFLYQSTPLLFAVTSPVIGIGSLVIFGLEIVEFFNYLTWYLSM